MKIVFYPAKGNSKNRPLVVESWGKLSLILQIHGQEGRFVINGKERKSSYVLSKVRKKEQERKALLKKEFKMSFDKVRKEVEEKMFSVEEARLFWLLHNNLTVEVEKSIPDEDGFCDTECHVYFKGVPLKFKS